MDIIVGIYHEASGYAHELKNRYLVHTDGIW
jgi:hypothetical protein